MNDLPFSSLSREERERYWNNLGKMIIVATVVVAALLGWFLFQEKKAITKNISTQSAGQTAVPSNTGNDISTNFAAFPTTSPLGPITNAN